MPTINRTGELKSRISFAIQKWHHGIIVKHDWFWRRIEPVQWESYFSGVTCRVLDSAHRITRKPTSVENVERRAIVPILRPQVEKFPVRVKNAAKRKNYRFPALSGTWTMENQPGWVRASNSVRNYSNLQNRGIKMSKIDSVNSTVCNRLDWKSHRIWRNQFHVQWYRICRDRTSLFEMRANIRKTKIS